MPEGSSSRSELRQAGRAVGRLLVQMLAQLYPLCGKGEDSNLQFCCY